MKIAIHQPEFFPWLGFFDKMARVDHFVVLDHVQFKKRYFENRNRIRMSDKAAWIMAPVLSKGLYKQKISDVRIHSDGIWQHKLIERVRHAYCKTPGFTTYFPELRELISNGSHNCLLSFNLAVIRFFRRFFEIPTPMTLSSQLGVDDFNGSDLILHICCKIGAGQYLSGSSGKDYLRLYEFRSAGIDVCWQNFTHPVYSQSGPYFISNLSALDYLFNCGAGKFPCSPQGLTREKGF